MKLEKRLWMTVWHPVNAQANTKAETVTGPDRMTGHEPIYPQAAGIARDQVAMRVGNHHMTVPRCG